MPAGREADLLLSFFDINVFHRGLYGPPSRSNWSRSYFSREVLCVWGGGGGGGGGGVVLYQIF